MAIKHEIIAALRNDIVFGKLKAGERLTEIELSSRFDCSRGPIREALAQIALEGFIILEHRRGARVAKVSAHDMKNDFSLLAMLEKTAAEWAMPNLQPEDLQLLLDINDKLKLYAGDETPRRLESWIRHNTEFHNVFWKRSGNFRLQEMIETVRLRLFRYCYTSLVADKEARGSCMADHDVIIESVRAGNAERVGHTVYRHVMHTKETLKAYYVKMIGL